MNNWWYYTRLFWQLFRRDLYAYSKKWTTFFINFMIVCPVVYALNYGYIMPNSGMINPTPELATLFFAGSVLQVIFPPAIGLAIGLYFDVHNSKFIHYQLTLAPARLIIVERIFFFATIIFVHAIPFYLISKWLLGAQFVTEHMTWWLLGIMLYLGSLFFSAFSVFFIFFIERIQQFGNFFNRLIYPMLQLGGVRMPFSVFLQYSTFLGFLVAFNPLMQLTEGLRRSILGGNNFMPFFISIGGLVLSCGLCVFFAIRYFYKRVDPV